jgi:hypothetical protein
MGIDLYNHDGHKFSDLGLQLRLPVDSIPSGQYSRHTNALADIEGQLETRAGVTLVSHVASDFIHTLFRLNQLPASPSATQRIFGSVDGHIYYQIVPGTDIVTGTPTFNGPPLSIIDFRFDYDSAAWAIVASNSGMYKIRVRDGGAALADPFLQWLLGEVPPTLAATATAGSSGNLNNGSGPGYDWRYTYVNSLVNTESNPSPIDIVGGAGTKYPTVNVNPDSAVTPPVTLVVGPKSTPWTLTGLLNGAYNFGVHDGTPPVAYTPTLVPGQVLKVSYISGTVRCSDARPHVNAAGQASYVTGSSNGPNGTPFPTKYMPGSTLGLGGLCGAFTDGSGQVIQPLSIGLGGQFVVPAGASRIQFGINDDQLNDNTDSGFTIQVTGVTPSPCANPTNAYDGNDTTYASFVGVSYPPSAQSCLFKDWVTVGTVVGLELNIDSEIITLIPGTGNIQVFVEYSIDSGVTWSTVYTTNTARGRRTDSINFAVGVNPSAIQVRAICAGNGVSGDNLSLSLRIYEINTNTLDGAATVLPLTDQEALVCVVPPTDPQQDTIRLYRRGGSLVDTWYKVGDFIVSTLTIGGCGTGTLEITDNVADGGLTSAIELDNDQPVTGITKLNTPLPIIWGPFDRRVLGVGDASRPDAVYFSKQGNADAWPPGNWVSVSSPSDPMQAGCVYNTRTFAFSHERMYELVPGLQSGVTFSPFPTPTTRGLISPYGLCTYDRVYFVAKDGIYATTGGPEVSIVENDIKPLFPTKDGPGRECHGYESVDMSQPEKIRLSAHNDEIWFTYKGAQTDTLQLLVYDIRKQRWRAAQYTPGMLCQYSEPGVPSSLLHAGADGSVYQSSNGTDNGFPIAVSTRTGAFDQGLPLSQKEYGSVVFDLDPGGAVADNPITITPYINGEAQAESAIEVIGDGRMQVPLSLDDLMAYNLEFEISWSRTDVAVDGNSVVPTLYQFDILWRPEPTQLTHWEARENSYGIAGYAHLRDGYLGIRCTEDLLMKFYLDGSATPFTTLTIPSTSGRRRKLFFALPANKWKLVRVTLDSPGGTPFRCYEMDCEFRIKQWLTPLGYRVVRLLGGESQFVSGAYASQLLGDSPSSGGQ